MLVVVKVLIYSNLFRSNVGDVHHKSLRQITCKRILRIIVKKKKKINYHYHYKFGFNRYLFTFKVSLWWYGWLFLKKQFYKELMNKWHSYTKLSVVKNLCYRPLTLLYLYFWLTFAYCISVRVNGFLKKEIASNVSSNS